MRGSDKVRVNWIQVLEREFFFFSKAKLKQDKVWKWENALSRLLSQRKTKANRLESDRSTKKVKIRDENSNSDVEMQGQAHDMRWSCKSKIKKQVLRAMLPSETSFSEMPSQNYIPKL